MLPITTDKLTESALSPKERETRAKDALERKYGKEFEISEVYPQKFLEEHFMVEAFAAEEPELRFTAEVSILTDEVFDSYAAVRVCAAIEEQAERNLDGLPGIYMVCAYVAGPQPSTANADIGIRDYASLDPMNRFRFELLFCPDAEAGTPEIWKSLSGMLRGLEFLPVEVWLRVVDNEQFDRAEELLTEQGPQSTEYKQLRRQVTRCLLPYEHGDLKMTEAELASAIRNGE